MKCLRKTQENATVGKVPYTDKRRALQAAAKTAKRVGVDRHILTVYKCPECGFWHFGNDIKKMSVKRRPEITMPSFP